MERPSSKSERDGGMAQQKPWSYNSHVMAWLGFYYLVWMFLCLFFTQFQGVRKRTTCRCLKAAVEKPRRSPCQLQAWPWNPAISRSTSLPLSVKKTQNIKPLAAVFCRSKVLASARLWDLLLSFEVAEVYVRLMGAARSRSLETKVERWRFC